MNKTIKDLKVNELIRITKTMGGHGFRINEIVKVINNDFESHEITIDDKSVYTPGRKCRSLDGYGTMTGFGNVWWVYDGEFKLRYDNISLSNHLLNQSE